MSVASQATSQERRYFWLLLLFAVVVIGAGIGLRDPWPSDEPRFTLAAKQMVESGDWLFPHRGAELYSDKPPMLMWTEAASYKLIGNWRIAFLLPSLLAALGTLLLVYDLGRRLWSRQAGLYAAAALLVSFQFVYQVKRAQIDPLVMFYITAANWGLLVHMLKGPNWRAFWFGCFCAGLGVITKGVGVLALFMLVPYVVAWRGGWDGVSHGGAGRWAWSRCSPRSRCGWCRCCWARRRTAAIRPTPVTSTTSCSTRPPAVTASRGITTTRLSITCRSCCSAGCRCR